MQSRQVFREEICENIRDAIFSGELRQGDKVVETLWAQKLGVSQGPVREAIRDLEAIGLLETVPFKGSRVCTLTKKNIMDNYGVRMCLESKSVKDVIDELDDEEMSLLIKELKKTTKKMYEAAVDGDLKFFIDADAKFHEIIIRATDNDVLLRMWKRCNLKNWLGISELLAPDMLVKIKEYHDRIIDAVSARNTKEALAILEDDVKSVMDKLIESGNY